MRTLALILVVVAALALPVGGGLATAGSHAVDAPDAGNTTDVVGNTSDTVDDTTENTTGTVDDTVNDTTDTVNDTTKTVDDTVNDTTDTVNDTIDSVGTATSVQTETATPATGNGPSTATATATRTATRNGTGATADRSNAGGGAGGDGRRSGGFGPAGGAVAVGVGAAVVAALTRRTAATAALGVVPDVPSIRTVFTTGRRAARNAVTAGREAVGDRLYRLLGLLGYSRHAADDPLDHETREALYRRIRTTPGQHLSALDEGTDGSFSTIRHHLGVLERADLVTSHRVRGRRRYFPAGVEEPELVSALVDESTTSVLRALARTGPATVSDLATELDRDPSTVTHHLQRLAEDGLVERERDGRRVVSSLAPGVAAALDDGPARASSD